jgi:hypothetical protein
MHSWTLFKSHRDDGNIETVGVQLACGETTQRVAVDWPRHGAATEVSAALQELAAKCHCLSSSEAPQPLVAAR